MASRPSEAPIHVSNVARRRPRDQEAAPGSGTASRQVERDGRQQREPCPRRASAPARTSDEHETALTAASPAAPEAASTATRSRRAARGVRLRERQQIPGLVKVVVNMGVGEAARDSKLIEGAVRDLTAITGQKPQSPRPASRSPSSSCVRACRSAPTSRCAATACGSSSTGCCRSALPRIRDFRGLSPKQFDGHGNYTFGLNEQSMFHEIDQDKIDRVRGMDITVVTTATTDDEGRALLKRARLPVQGELSMAKTALVNKANSQAEVRGARLHPLPALRPSALGLPQVRPVPDLPARDGPPRRAPRRHQVQLVIPGMPAGPAASTRRTRGIRTTQDHLQRRSAECCSEETGEKGRRSPMTMTDPIADMLTRVCATRTRRTTTPSRCRSRSSRATSPRSSRPRATSPVGPSRTPRSARRSPST